MKCWNCGGETGESTYYAEGDIICGFCAESFAEAEGDRCKYCDKSDFNWSNERNNLVCNACGKESD